MKKEQKNNEINVFFLCQKNESVSDETGEILNKIKDKKEVIYDEFHNFNEFNYNLLNDSGNFKKLERKKNIKKSNNLNLYRNSIKKKNSLSSNKNFLPIINSNNKNTQNEKKNNKNHLNLTLNNYQNYKMKNNNLKNNYNSNNEKNYSYYDPFYNKLTSSQKNITTNNSTLLNSLNTTNKLNESLLNNKNINNNEISLNSNRSIKLNKNQYKLKIKEGLINLNYNNNKIKNKIDKRKKIFNNFKENFDLRYKRFYFKYLLSENQKELIPENIDYEEALSGKQTFLKKLDKIITKLKGDIILVKTNEKKNKDFKNVLLKRKKNENIKMNKIERLLEDNQIIANKIV